MTFLRSGLLACGLALAAAAAAAREGPLHVVTDIAPVQSIVASVMAGVGEPGLILPPGASPHHYALRPSEAQRVQAADVVVWVGPVLTPWLADPIDSLAGDADLVTLAGAPGVETLPVREGGLFEADPDEAHAHGGEAIDPHLWLDPANAAAIAAAVAQALSAADPEHAAAYSANADRFGREMAGLEAAIGEALAPVKGKQFVVFHDAYQYFEHRFGIAATASVAVAEGAPPGAARVAAIRDLMRSEDVACAFAEPQFEPGLLATLTEGTEVRTSTLDPLGADIEPGPGLYPALLQRLSAQLASCLAG